MRKTKHIYLLLFLFAITITNAVSQKKTSTYNKDLYIASCAICGAKVDVSAIVVGCSVKNNYIASIGVMIKAINSVTRGNALLKFCMVY